MLRPSASSRARQCLTLIGQAICRISGLLTPDRGVISWQDPNPAAAIEHVGLSSWDHHVAYRDIQLVSKPVMSPPPAAQQLQGSLPAAAQDPSCAVYSLQVLHMLSPLM